MVYLSPVAVNYIPTTYNFCQVSNNERNHFAWTDERCYEAEPGDRCCDQALFDDKMVIDGRSFYLIDYLHHDRSYVTDLETVETFEYYAIEDQNNNGRIDREDNAVLIENKREMFCFQDEVDLNAAVVKEIVTPLGSRVRMGYWQIPAVHSVFDFFPPDSSPDRSYRNPFIEVYPPARDGYGDPVFSGFSVMEDRASESLDGSYKSVIVEFDLHKVAYEKTAEAMLEITAHFKAVGRRELVETIDFRGISLKDDVYEYNGAVQIDIPLAYRQGFLSLDYQFHTTQTITLELKPPLFVEEDPLACREFNVVDRLACESAALVYNFFRSIGSWLT